MAVGMYACMRREFVRQAVLLAAKSLQQAPPVEQQHQRRHHTASQVAVNGVIALLVRASNSGLILGDQFERGIAMAKAAVAKEGSLRKTNALTAILTQLQEEDALQNLPAASSSEAGSSGSFSMVEKAEQVRQTRVACLLEGGAMLPPGD